MPVQITRRFVPIAAAALACACADPAALTSPDGAAVLASRAGLACVEVDASGSAGLGFVQDEQGGIHLGGLPGPFSVGGIEGTLYSYVIELWAGGNQLRAANHITLRHIFTSDDQSSSFWTDDRATCAQDPNGPLTCRLSDQMTVVGGTGAFAGATGKLHNRGTLDFGRFLLTYSMKGRVCAEGL